MYKYIVSWLWYSNYTDDQLIKYKNLLELTIEILKNVTPALQTRSKLDDVEYEINRRGV